MIDERIEQVRIVILVHFDNISNILEHVHLLFLRYWLLQLIIDNFHPFALQLRDPSVDFLELGCWLGRPKYVQRCLTHGRALEANQVSGYLRFIARNCHLLLAIFALLTRRIMMLSGRVSAGEGHAVVPDGLGLLRLHVIYVKMLKHWLLGNEVIGS